MIKKRIIIHKGVWREKIINVIAEHPGIHLRQIQKTLNIPLGTLTHHLQRLEKQEKIISTKHKHFDYKYYWAKEQYNPQHVLIQYKLKPLELYIYSVINNNPGIIQKQIISETKKTRCTITRHLKTMKEKKIIWSRRVGETKHFFIKKHK